MLNISHTLDKLKAESIPYLKLENIETGLHELWGAWPSAMIDTTKLKEGMTSLPLYRADGHFNPEHVLSHFAIRIDPDDVKKMLVVPISSCTKRSNVSGLIYQYHRPFQVNVGTDMQVFVKLYSHLTKRNTPASERIRLDYGDVNTLRSWEETYDVEGYVGCSTGKKRVFTLIHNKRSTGGGVILSDCILSIRTTKKEAHQLGKPKSYYYFYELAEMFTNPLKKIEGV